MKEIYLIAAADLNNGIGINGVMPWDLKEDMKHFQKITRDTQDFEKQNMVIMGRTTWESIPEAHRPLKGRKNVVLTRSADYPINGAILAHSLDEAIEMADEGIESIFIIGGANVYAQAITREDVTGVYLTRIQKEYECDAFFPEIPERFSQKTILSSGEEDGIKFDFELHSKS